MLHNDYKRIFNEIIDNNLNLLHTLDDVEGVDGGKMDDKTRRNLEKTYKSIRETINLNLRLSAADILFLGTSANLALISLNTSYHRLQKTLKWYNEILLPAFEKIRKLEGEGKDSVIDTFYEDFANPINLPTDETNTIEDSVT